STLSFSPPPPPPSSTLFPYTTLFRSARAGVRRLLERVREPEQRTLVEVAAEELEVDAAARHGGVGLDRLADRHRHRGQAGVGAEDRKSTRLNSSHVKISYAVFCLKKK